MEKYNELGLNLNISYEVMVCDDNKLTNKGTKFNKTIL